MGDKPVDVARTAIVQAIDATAAATAAVETLEDNEQSASVGRAIAAARFDLNEALRRLGP
jgi:hypothetical protein